MAVLAIFVVASAIAGANDIHYPDCGEEMAEVVKADPKMKSLPKQLQKRYYRCPRCGKTIEI